MSTEIDIQSLVAVLHMQRDLAKTQITRGAALVVLVPVVAVAMISLAVVFDSIWPVVAMVLYVLAGGTFGVASVIVGGASLRSSNKQLKQLEGERIPQARLLT